MSFDIKCIFKLVRNVTITAPGKYLNCSGEWKYKVTYSAIFKTLKMIDFNIHCSGVYFIHKYYSESDQMDFFSNDYHFLANIHQYNFGLCLGIITIWFNELCHEAI